MGGGGVVMEDVKAKEVREKNEMAEKEMDEMEERRLEGTKWRRKRWTRWRRSGLRAYVEAGG